MKKEILIKGIAVPFAIGLLLAVAFFFAFDSQYICPVEEKTVIANHDDTDRANEIGTLSFDKSTLTLYEKASYSDFVQGASIEQGTGVDQTGVTYIKVFQNNIKTLMERDITVTTKDSEHYYSYVGAYSANSEYAVLLNKPAMKNGIVLYYQKSDGIGFSDKYEALVYKEVQ
ncbi:MAG: hypothetical protein ACI4IL_08200 [Eubacterium sp.]